MIGPKLLLSKTKIIITFYQNRRLKYRPPRPNWPIISTKMTVSAMFRYNFSNLFIWKYTEVFLMKLFCTVSYSSVQKSFLPKTVRISDFTSVKIVKVHSKSSKAVQFLFQPATFFPLYYIKSVQLKFSLKIDTSNMSTNWLVFDILVSSMICQ